MRLLGKENLMKLSPVLGSKYYTKWIRYLDKFLKYSRQEKYYKDPVNLLGLQMGISKTLGEIEKTVRDGEIERARVEKLNKPDTKKKIKDIEIGIEMNRQIARVIKVIADGLAWRVLNFDRPFLRSMAESKKYFGSVDLLSESYKGTEEAAMNLVSLRGNLILLTDITHFLRFGDIIEVGERTVIYEAKNMGKKLHSIYSVARKGPKNLPGKQLKTKIIPAQILRDKRITLVNGKPGVILDLPLKLENHLSEVNDLIKEAREKLFAYKEFGDYLAVSCTDGDQLIQESIKAGRQLWKDFKQQKPNWNKDDIVLTYSNFDPFYDYGGDFLRTGTPYSIYPFDVNDCMDLISGKLRLSSWLNISAFKRIFRKAGYEVIDIDKDAVMKRNKEIEPKLYSGELFEFTINDTAFIVRKDGFNMQIPLFWIIRTATEFIDPKTLISEAEFLIKNLPKNESPLITTHILGEKDVWV